MCFAVWTGWCHVWETNLLLGAPTGCTYLLPGALTFVPICLGGRRPLEGGTSQFWEGSFASGGAGSGAQPAEHRVCQHSCQENLLFGKQHLNQAACCSTMGNICWWEAGGDVPSVMDPAARRHSAPFRASSQWIPHLSKRVLPSLMHGGNIYQMPTICKSSC